MKMLMTLMKKMKWRTDTMNAKIVEKARTLLLCAIMVTAAMMPMLSGATDEQLREQDSLKYTMISTSGDVYTEEGEWGYYDVCLDEMPNGVVIITPSSDNEDVEVLPAYLKFSKLNWDECMWFDVMSSDDDDATDTTATISHTIDGTDSIFINSTIPDVMVTAYDMDSDIDGDDLPDDLDDDMDGDGVINSDDAFPEDSYDSEDNDGDGVGDNADMDDDNDGVNDTDDWAPLDDSEQLDTDGDGVGDNSDAFPDDANETDDGDSDGVGDNSDVFPDDGNETIDTDGDGVGDTSDVFPVDSTEWNDTDGDGVGDNSDAFPDDSTEDSDADNDGVGDNADAFPNDATETIDTDGDGVGNNADTDDDNDTVLDSDEISIGVFNGTNFNADCHLIVDCDGDGYDDADDAFDVDPDAWDDTDGDGLADSFPNLLTIIDGDSLCYLSVTSSDDDSDGDGYEDQECTFDLESGESAALRLQTRSYGSEVGLKLTFPDGTQIVWAHGYSTGFSTSTFYDLGTISDSGEYTLQMYDSYGDGCNGSTTSPCYVEAVLQIMGMPSSTEYGTVLDADDDGDSWSDVDEGLCGTDSLNNTDVPLDTDGDLTCDIVDDDDDDDGVLDSDEVDGAALGANGEDVNCVLTVDCDGDGVDDGTDSNDDDPLEQTDMDGDGIGDNSDSDRDGDGYGNANDAFENDSTEWEDSDGDGVGDNADTDDDDDGTPDDIDDFPYDADQQFDVDGDGWGNNADMDDDGDGIEDQNDDDDDGDGYSDVDEDTNCVGGNSQTDDVTPNDNDGDMICDSLDDDDDDDGTDDVDDDFPMDECADTDTDGDGMPDSIVADCSTDLTEDQNDDYDDGNAPSVTFDISVAGDYYDYYYGEGSVLLDGTSVYNAYADWDMYSASDAGDHVVYSFSGVSGDSFTVAADDAYSDGGLSVWVQVDGVTICGPLEDSYSSSATSCTFDASDYISALTWSDDDEATCDTDPTDSSDEPTDTDGDNLCDDDQDNDNDGDGTNNSDDAFPLDATEDIDTDGDGVGDNADTDDDDDGTADTNDAFPLDDAEDTDTDGDGVGDNADTDDDGDGWSDADEATCGSDDPSDTDGDGVCDGSDADDDGDGVDDGDESGNDDTGIITSAYFHDDDNDGNYQIIFNFTQVTVVSGGDLVSYIDMWDGSSWDSIDGTGWSSGDRDQFSCSDDYWCDEYDGTSYLRFRIINSGHATVENATAYFDPASGEISGILCAIDADCDDDGVGDADEADGSGIGTNGADVDCTLVSDCDGDTYDDSVDSFPIDSSEWNDTDGDGYGDNDDDLDIDGDGLVNAYDACPYDSTEYYDTDGDGICDNADDDDDNDGVSDDEDVAPLDGDESTDWDGDGIGDNTDADDDGDGIDDDVDVDENGESQAYDFDNDGWDDDDEATCGTNMSDTTDVPTDNDDDGLCNDIQDDDNDNDGTNNTNDAFPLDPDAWDDNDGDGLADSFPNLVTIIDGDSLCYLSVTSSDDDSDGDGYEDQECTFDLESGESAALRLQTRSYGSEVGLKLTFPDGTQTVWAHGSSTGFSSSTFYDLGTISDSGEYTLQMYDSYGDGCNGSTTSPCYVEAVLQIMGMPSSTEYGTVLDDDDDNDGYSDVDEDTNCVGGNSLTDDVTPNDNDGDMTCDSLDDDDDNDGYSDVDEDTNCVGGNSLTDDVTPNDNDGDMICDSLDDDDDNDGYSDADEDTNCGAEEDTGAPFSDSLDYMDTPPDNDGDMICDELDDDDDGDGTDDVDDDYPMDPCADLDTDGDGIPDSLVDGCTTNLMADEDDDDDGFSDADEVSDCGTSSDPLDDESIPLDTDGDMWCDEQDDDDDNDGYMDDDDAFPVHQSSNVDTDGDGMPDFIGDVTEHMGDDFEVGNWTGMDWNAEDAHPNWGWDSMYGEIFLCEDGLPISWFGNNSFVPSYWINDGYVDCNDGSDESVDLETFGPATTGWERSGDTNFGLGTGSLLDGYAAKASGLEANESAILSITVDTDEGILMFDILISTEERYDELCFYVDGYEEGCASGQEPRESYLDEDGEWLNFMCEEAGLYGDEIPIDWVQDGWDDCGDSDGDGISDDEDSSLNIWTYAEETAEVYVTAGMHTFEWIYSKDADTDGGADRIYIDNIMFPMAVQGDSDLVLDMDDDNDGIDDIDDACPLDDAEQIDTDGDGFCDNQDSDDDNDGVYDFNDAVPLDPDEQYDFDGDGIGDNADLDDDNDSCLDELDDLPFDDSSCDDLDGDGIGDEYDVDDDGDNVMDVDDPFPEDGTAWLDNDGDGLPDFNGVPQFTGDFETGSLGDYDTFGDADWSVVDATTSISGAIINGTFSAESGDIDNSQTSSLEVEWTTIAGDMSFEYVTSTESNWDYLRFYVDGALQASWSGQTAGVHVQSITAGTHTFEWQFYKDGSVSSYDDTVWIDDVSLPLVQMSNFNNDTDDDNDGVMDDYDVDPLNPCVSIDTDMDGLPDDVETGMIDMNGAGDEAYMVNCDDSESNPYYADSDDDNDEWSDEDEFACGSDHLNATDMPGDFDYDGLCDVFDDDSDNDLVPDTLDAFPFDYSESVDYDGDGIGDNADPDDDNDNVPDVDDTFPYDANESEDLDGDGIGDNADNDTDGDGVPNDEDSFPTDDQASTDTDGDGIDDDADSDDDDDGYPDVVDWAPLDSAEWTDSDGDGVGDNADTDDDNDGVLDELDAFPYDSSEYTDLDGDEIGDNSDTDIDGDGVNNNVDAFPEDGGESRDLDLDGIGDNADTDRDGDGVSNAEDLFPDNGAESVDYDMDGIGDNSDVDDDDDGDLDEFDAFPYDITEWDDTDADAIGNNADTDDDGDGFTDVLEDQCGSDNLDVNSVPSDYDGDGICDAQDSDVSNDEIKDNTQDDLGWSNAVPGFPALFAALALVGAAIIGRRNDD